MSECDRFEMLISEYVDGELQEPEKTELELHLKRCSRCRRLCDAFRAISLSLGEEAAPAGFTAQVMAAVSTRGESGATMAKKPGKSWPKYLALAACLALAVLTTVRLSPPSRGGGGGAGPRRPPRVPGGPPRLVSLIPMRPPEARMRLRRIRRQRALRTGSRNSHMTIPRS